MTAPKRREPGREIARGASDVKSRSTGIGDPIPRRGRKTSATAEAWSKKRPFYRPLPKAFRRNGFSYREIAREQDAAIYEQSWTGCRNPSIAYEVVRVRRREGFEIAGRWVRPAEVYPNSQVWGVDGFTFADGEAAFAKLRNIIASSNTPARFGKNRKQNRLEKSPT